MGQLVVSIFEGRHYIRNWLGHDVVTTLMSHLTQICDTPLVYQSTLSCPAFRQRKSGIRGDGSW